MGDLEDRGETAECEAEPEADAEPDGAGDSRRPAAAPFSPFDRPPPPLEGLVDVAAYWWGDKFLARLGASLLLLLPLLWLLLFLSPPTHEACGLSRLGDDDIMPAEKVDARVCAGRSSWGGGAAVVMSTATETGRYLDAILMVLRSDGAREGVKVWAPTPALVRSAVLMEGR